MTLVYGSVCSGIEAASVAWRPLGWRASFLSEIEAFPRAVLAHHYPETPLHGDFTTIRAGEYEPIDLLVGGTPCQSFSVAGLRGGLDDDRGNLALEYLRLADRLRPRWLVWENVPGVLSSNGGRDFGSILGGMGELGYGVAYRVLDAQFFGVAQRRRRVFVVGYLGDWRRAAAVLFERHSLSGHPAPRREAGTGVTVSPSLRAQSNSSHREDSQAFVAATLRARDTSKGVDSDCTDTLIPAGIGQDGQTARALTASHTASHTATGRLDPNECTLIAHTLKGEGFDASEDGTGRGTPLVAVPHVDLMPTMMNGANTPAGHSALSGHSKDAYVTPVAFNWQGGGEQTSLGYDPSSEISGALSVGQTPAVHASAVRRLTPRECERLQGFPDGWTQVPHRGKPADQCADGPRYKALGNSMAVPCMLWLGQRIQQVEAICSPVKAAA